MDILVARTEQEIQTAYERLRRAVHLGCDTETSGFSARNGRLYSVQFSDGEFNVLIPISEGVRLGPITGILANDAIIKIFHNARFDLDFLHENGYGVQNVFDTMIAEKVLTRGARQSASLAETLYRYFAVDLDKTQRAKFSRKWDGIWSDDLVHYALSDVVHLPRLMEEQNAWMGQLGMLDDYAAQLKKMMTTGGTAATTGDMPGGLP